MPTKAVERWNRDGLYLKSFFEEKGYTVELKWEDNDISRQVSDIEILLADNVDAIVVVPIDGSTLAIVLNEASERGIPVVYYDRLVLDTECDGYYVSFDNYNVGCLQGTYIEEALGLETAAEEGRHYNMEIVSGDPVDNNASFFYNGAMDMLGKYIDSGVLSVPSGQISQGETATDSWSAEKALNRMQNILSSYYADGTQLDAVLCAADLLSVSVVQALDMDYTGGNTVILTGQDGDEANLRYIVDGKQSMTVYKRVSDLALVTAGLVDTVLAGGQPDESFAAAAGVECKYDTQSYYDGRKYVRSVLLTPVAVTADNIQEELIDTGDYVWEDGYPVKAENAGGGQ